MILHDPSTLATFSSLFTRPGFFAVNDNEEHKEIDEARTQQRVPSRIHKDLPIVWFPDSDGVSDTDLQTSSHIVLVLKGTSGTYTLEFFRDAVRMYGRGSKSVDFSSARKSYQEYGLYCLYAQNYFDFEQDLTLVFVAVDPTANELQTMKVLEMFLRPSVPDPFCSQSRDGYYFPDYSGILRSSQ